MSSEDSFDIAKTRINQELKSLIATCKKKYEGSQRNLLNKWFQDSVKNYFLEQYAAPLLLKHLGFTKIDEVKRVIHGNLTKSDAKFMLLVYHYYNLLEQFQEVENFKRKMEHVVLHLQNQVQENTSLPYNYSKVVRKQFIAIILLTYCDQRTQNKIPGCFYELWNIAYPYDQQSKKKLSKYDTNRGQTSLFTAVKEKKLHQRQSYRHRPSPSEDNSETKALLFLQQPPISQDSRNQSIVQANNSTQYNSNLPQSQGLSYSQNPSYANMNTQEVQFYNKDVPDYHNYNPPQTKLNQNWQQHNQPQQQGSYDQQQYQLHQQEQFQQHHQQQYQQHQYQHQSHEQQNQQDEQQYQQHEQQYQQHHQLQHQLHQQQQQHHQQQQQQQQHQQHQLLKEEKLLRQQQQYQQQEHQQQQQNVQFYEQQLQQIVKQEKIEYMENKNTCQTIKPFENINIKQETVFAPKIEFDGCKENILNSLLNYYNNDHSTLDQFQKKLLETPIQIKEEFCIEKNGESTNTVERNNSQNMSSEQPEQNNGCNNRGDDEENKKKKSSEEILDKKLSKLEDLDDNAMSSLQKKLDGEQRPHNCNTINEQQTLLGKRKQQIDINSLKAEVAKEKDDSGNNHNPNCFSNNNCENKIPLVIRSAFFNDTKIEENTNNQYNTLPLITANSGILERKDSKQYLVVQNTLSSFRIQQVETPSSHIFQIQKIKQETPAPQLQTCNYPQKIQCNEELRNQEQQQDQSLNTYKKQYLELQKTKSNNAKTSQMQIDSIQPKQEYIQKDDSTANQLENKTSNNTQINPVQSECIQPKQEYIQKNDLTANQPMNQEEQAVNTLEESEKSQQKVSPNQKNNNQNQGEFINSSSSPLPPAAFQYPENQRLEAINQNSFNQKICCNPSTNYNQQNPPNYQYFHQSQSKGFPNYDYQSQNASQYPPHYYNQPPNNSQNNHLQNPQYPQQQQQQRSPYPPSTYHQSHFQYSQPNPPARQQIPPSSPQPQFSNTQNPPHPQHQYSNHSQLSPSNYKQQQMPTNISQLPSAPKNHQISPGHQSTPSNYSNMTFQHNNVIQPNHYQINPPNQQQPQPSQQQLPQPNNSQIPHFYSQGQIPNQQHLPPPNYQQSTPQPSQMNYLQGPPPPNYNQNHLPNYQQQPPQNFKQQSPNPPFNYNQFSHTPSNYQQGNNIHNNYQQAPASTLNYQQLAHPFNGQQKNPNVHKNQQQIVPAQQQQTNQIVYENEQIAPAQSKQQSNLKVIDPQQPFQENQTQSASPIQNTEEQNDKTSETKM